MVHRYDSDARVHRLLPRPANTCAADRADKGGSSAFRHAGGPAPRTGFRRLLRDPGLSGGIARRPQEPQSHHRRRHFDLVHHDRAVRAGKRFPTAVCGPCRSGCRRGDPHAGCSVDDQRLLPARAPGAADQCLHDGHLAGQRARLSDRRPAARTAARPAADRDSGPRSRHSALAGRVPDRRSVGPAARSADRDHPRTRPAGRQSRARSRDGARLHGDGMDLHSATLAGIRLAHDRHVRQHDNRLLLLCH